MYRITHSANEDLPDTAAFIDTLNALRESRIPEARQLFDPHNEIVISRAPGRLDVMGGIADYSGSLVLELPIKEATFAALQRDHSRHLKIVSLSDDSSEAVSFVISLPEIEPDGRALDYDSARALFSRDPEHRWAAYVAGVFLVLMRERGVRFSEGARILISSRVPQGKGVSSSAALEVAVMQAVASAFGISISSRELALLCQMVENHVVGAPCGVMDQMTTACGVAHHLLALLCQPAELQGTVAVPDHIAFWGLDSGVRHAVSGSDYGSVRVGAFMGYRIIAEIARLRASGTGQPVEIDDRRYGGYLANVPPSEFEQTFAACLPDRIDGGEFLSRYSGTTDPVTRVEEDRSYAVRAPAAHAVYEHHRVRLFAELLKGEPEERRLELLGELMYQSHASYSACGLGSDRTNRLVELVREAGPAQGLYGAKITGGGSGGTVAVLGHADSGAAVEAVAKKYARETGHQPYVFAGSSPGSSAFGSLRLGSARDAE